MIDSDPSLQVGKRLRELRKARGLTLRELAEASGLSLNAISLIERGKTSPTIVTLQKLAGALGFGLVHLLAEDDDKEVIFMRREQRPPTRSGKVLLRSLGTGLTNQAMEPLLVTLEPEADSGSDAMMHPGHELVYCLDGEIQYEIDGVSYLLRAGDSLLFDASLPHYWRNKEAAEARALLVVQSLSTTHKAPF